MSLDVVVLGPMGAKTKRLRAFFCRAKVNAQFLEHLERRERKEKRGRERERERE